MVSRERFRQVHLRDRSHSLRVRCCLERIAFVEGRLFPHFLLSEVGRSNRNKRSGHERQRAIGGKQKRANDSKVGAHVENGEFSATILPFILPRFISTCICKPLICAPVAHFGCLLNAIRQRDAFLLPPAGRCSNDQLEDASRSLKHGAAPWSCSL